MTGASPQTDTSPVQRAREAAGMSRELLAGKAGVALKTVERIERGEGTPRRSTLACIAQVFGVEPEELAA